MSLDSRSPAEFKWVPCFFTVQARLKGWWCTLSMFFQREVTRVWESKTNPQTKATCIKYSNSPLAEKASFVYTNFNLLSSLKLLNLYPRSRCQHVLLVSPLFLAYIWLPSHCVLTWPFLCMQRERNILLMYPLIIIMLPLLSG